MLEEQRGGGDKGHTEVTMSSLDLFRASQGITNLGMQVLYVELVADAANRLPVAVNLIRFVDSSELFGCWVCSTRARIFAWFQGENVRAFLYTE